MAATAAGEWSSTLSAIGDSCNGTPLAGSGSSGACGCWPRPWRGCRSSPNRALLCCEDGFGPCASRFDDQPPAAQPSPPRPLQWQLPRPEAHRHRGGGPGFGGGSRPRLGAPAGAGRRSSRGGRPPAQAPQHPDSRQSLPSRWPQGAHAPSALDPKPAANPAEGPGSSPAGFAAAGGPAASGRAVGGVGPRPAAAALPPTLTPAGLPPGLRAPGLASGHQGALQLRSHRARGPWPTWRAPPPPHDDPTRLRSS